MKKIRKGSGRGLENTMKLLSIHMPNQMIDSINALVLRAEFPNFSEAVRYMIKVYLENFGEPRK